MNTQNQNRMQIERVMIQTQRLLKEGNQHIEIQLHKGGFVILATRKE